MKSPAGKWQPCPFPGLRPYRFEESHLFFGRDRQVLDLLDRLRTNRFLAVLGPSGGGKSSLVRAGLLPALYGGFMAGSVSTWEIAQFRPGTEPLGQLRKAVEATLGPLVDSPEAETDLGFAAASQRRPPTDAAPYTSRSLVDWAASKDIQGSRGLLVVADQFEEAIRNRGESAGLLVEMLIAASDQVKVPIYVVLTMRHDYLGECAHFLGLPEVLNKSQYLMPSLTREERQEAIEGPLRITGVSISNRLVQTLLRESASLGSGSDTKSKGQRRLGDSLPVLQHTLFRTYQQWEKEGGQEIDLRHYDAVGGIAKALGNHANEVVARLPEVARAAVPGVFRCLTVADAGRIVRRATDLDTIVSVTGEVRERVAAVVDAFSSERNCLLDQRRAPDVVDLLHESLIDNWSELREWALTESRDLDDYVDMRRGAERFASGDRSALLRGRPLGEALARLRSARLNPAWARQYGQGGTYEAVRAFIARSRRAWHVRWIAAAGVILLAAIGIGLGYRAYEGGIRRAETTAAANAAAQLRAKDAQFQAQLAAERELASRQAPGAERDLALATIEIRSLRAQLETAMTGRQQSPPDSAPSVASSAARDRISELERSNRDLAAQKQAGDTVASARIRELEERLSRVERPAISPTPAPVVVSSPVNSAARSRVTCKPAPPNLPWWEYWEEAKRSNGTDTAKTVSYLLAAIATGPAAGDSVAKRDEIRDPGGRVTQYFPHRLLAEQFAQMTAEDIAACYEAQPRKKN